MFGLFPLRHRGPGRAIVAGMFTTVNGASPTAVRGQGFTVAWVAEGRWTVTLDKPVNAFDAILVSVAAETLFGAGTQELIEVYVDQDSIDTDSFEIVQLRNTDTSGAASALQDDPGSMISFLAVCRIGNHNA